MCSPAPATALRSQRRVIFTTFNYMAASGASATVKISEATYKWSVTTA